MNDANVLTVTELTRRLKDVVEAHFAYVWVAGEVSNCTRAASGHIYLTLKDHESQLRAVVWRSRARRLKFTVQDGLEVVAAGPVEVYAARGSYQLIVEELVPRGIGALELALRQLQQKLAAEGLFDAERKRPLPRFPRRIALVTSPTGAAVQDMLQVIGRRWRAADIVIVPVPVQGEGAAAKIAHALRTVHQIPGVDVVIVGRGGGSLEDLWAFNEEIVARAISDCRIPVISAVGHEIDTSIADLVADRRALTPSEAGELVVPHRDEVLTELARLHRSLYSALNQQARRARLRLEAITSRRVFQHPLEWLHDKTARIDELATRLHGSVDGLMEKEKARLSQLAGRLQALSPLDVLKRGYTVTRRAESGELIRNVEELSAGDRLTTDFATGRVESRVETVEPHAGRIDRRSGDDRHEGA